MENYLIVLIFIGSIIYKVYTNYKDEVEKAKKRQPQRVPMPQTVTNPTSKSVNQGTKPYIPTSSTQYSHMISREATINNIPDEVRKVRDSKENTPLATKEEENTNERTIEFDLRQAVIQSIILERPYK